MKTILLILKRKTKKSQDMNEKMKKKIESGKVSIEFIKWYQNGGQKIVMRKMLTHKDEIAINFSKGIKFEKCFLKSSRLKSFEIYYLLIELQKDHLN